MVRRILWLAGFVGMVVALWPSADSLYALTGEEATKGQMLGVLHWVQTAVRPQPQLAAAAVRQTDTPIAGMNTFLQNEVEIAKREKALDLLEAANFQFIRQEFPWEDIEIHGKGDFTDRRNLEESGEVSAWIKYDNIVALAAARDLEIIGRLSNPPAWSRAAGNDLGEAAPPDDFNDYADFVAATVERYKGRVRYYQLMNEPNTDTEWGRQAVDPEAYTELLCMAYRRAKAIDPDVIILSGALAQTIANVSGDNLGTYHNMNDVAYLTRMYEAGAADCFDILSAQGYGLWSGPTDQRLQPTYINVQRHKFYRDVMVAYGDSAKPIWISEAGWNSVPASWGFAQYGRVDEATKGRYAAEMLARSLEEWSWIGVINLWYMREPAPNTTIQAYYFRMMDDFTPLPSWDGVTAFTTGEMPVRGGQDAQAYRPTLLIVSLAVFFFTSLQLLLPDDET